MSQHINLQHESISSEDTNPVAGGSKQTHRECPHCGGQFKIRGFASHEKACIRKQALKAHDEELAQNFADAQASGKSPAGTPTIINSSLCTLIIQPAAAASRLRRVNAALHGIAMPEHGRPIHLWGRGHKYGL